MIHNLIFEPSAPCTVVLRDWRGSQTSLPEASLKSKKGLTAWSQNYRRSPVWIELLYLTEQQSQEFGIVQDTYTKQRFQGDVLLFAVLRWKPSRPPSALCIIPSTSNSPFKIISLPARAPSQYCSCSALWYGEMCHTQTGKPMDWSFTTWTSVNKKQEYLEGLRFQPPHTIPRILEISLLKTSFKTQKIPKNLWSYHLRLQTMQRSEAPCGVALDFLPGVWGTITHGTHQNATLEKSSTQKWLRLRDMLNLFPRKVAQKTSRRLRPQRLADLIRCPPSSFLL